MLKVVKLTESAKLPTKAHPTDAGFDLYCDSDVKISPNFAMFFWKNVWTYSTTATTGISLKIPDGYYGRIASKSGLASKGIEVGAGVIDSSYTGEIKVLLRNYSWKSYEFQAGDKIAQLIITHCSSMGIEEAQSLEETERGSGGFGSTGKS